MAATPRRQRLDLTADAVMTLEAGDIKTQYDAETRARVGSPHFIFKDDRASLQPVLRKGPA